MCDFENIELYQPQSKHGEWIEPQVSPDNSMEEEGEEKIEANDQEDDTNEGGEHV